MNSFKRLVAAGFAACFVIGLAGAAQAATVNTTIDFTSGSSSGGAIKTYVEGDYEFYDARIVGGPCALPGGDKCAALNPHEMTVLTRTDGGTFDLTSIWFYLNGKVKDGSNSFSVFDTNNITHRFDFTQPTYAHNTGYTEILDFIGVTSISFFSGGTNDKGNARFDVALVSHTTIDPPPPPAVPLPAAGWLLLAGLGGLAGMRKRSTKTHARAASQG